MNTKQILKSFQKQEIRTPISEGMFLPNHSGDHSAGIVRTTPIVDDDITNKAYVDSTANAKVSDTVYGAGWDTVTTIAPSKNAVYDKIEAVVASIPAAGANTALSNLAAVAINSALLLGTSDAAALGSATKMWSDLFLAKGGVINFSNGGMTITHFDNSPLSSEQTLTFSGSDCKYVFTSSGTTGSIARINANSITTADALSIYIIGQGLTAGQAFYVLHDTEGEANGNLTGEGYLAHFEEFMLEERSSGTTTISGNAVEIEAYFNMADATQGANGTLTITGHMLQISNTLQLDFGVLTSTGKAININHQSRNSAIVYAIGVASANSGTGEEGGIDLSGIPAGAKNLKINATTDTPSITWTAGVPSNNPSGYMEIDVAGAARYVPYWI